MTPSQQIIIDAGRALRERVLSIADDLAFNQFRRDVFEAHNLSTADLGRIAGIAERHVKGKRAAGTAAAIKAQGATPPAELVANGKPYQGKRLTREEHGDPDAPDDLDAWWWANCPLQYRADLFAAHIDSLDTVTWAFRHFLARDPSLVGMDYYTTQINKGRPVWAVIREIELSDEARGLK